MSIWAKMKGQLPRLEQGIGPGHPVLNVPRGALPQHLPVQQPMVGQQRPLCLDTAGQDHPRQGICVVDLHHQFTAPPAGRQHRAVPIHGHHVGHPGCACGDHGGNGPVLSATSDPRGRVDAEPGTDHPRGRPHHRTYPRRLDRRGEPPWVQDGTGGGNQAFVTVHPAPLLPDIGTETPPFPWAEIPAIAPRSRQAPFNLADLQMERSNGTPDR